MQGIMRPGLGPLSGLSPLGPIFRGAAVGALPLPHTTFTPVAPTKTRAQTPHVPGALQLRFPRPGIDVERADLRHLEAFLRQMQKPGRTLMVVLHELPRNPLTRYRLTRLARRFDAALLVKDAR